MPKDTDATFDEQSQYGSTAWVCATLGVSKDKFRSVRPKLLDHGFPDRDPLMNLYIKADIQAWIELRRSIRNQATVESPTTDEEINYDEL